MQRCSWQPPSVASGPAEPISHGPVHRPGRALNATITGSPFIEVVIELVRRSGAWSGTATELLAVASRSRPEFAGRSWPPNASAASQQLDEHAIALRREGIEFRRERQAGGSRECQILLTCEERATGRGGTGESNAGDPR
jgi:hypothetical protein